MRTSPLVLGIGSLVASLVMTAFGSAQVRLGLDARPKAVSEQDWKLSEGKRLDDKDIRSRGGGQYIGGIDRYWTLVVSGPPRKRFYYQFIDFSKKTVGGTWTIEDGLARFAGNLTIAPVFEKANPKESKVKFAVGYLFHKNEVWFDVLRRTNKGKYRYEKVSYHADSKKEQRREHIRLAYKLVERAADSLEWQVQGECTRWDEQGKVTKKEPIDAKVVYKRDGKFFRTGPGLPAWLPLVIQPIEKGDDPKGYALGASSFGNVRGFGVGLFLSE